MKKSILIFLLFLISSSTYCQNTFKKEKLVKNKALNNALNLSVKKFVEIESLSSNGIHEWITLNPENGDTLLYKALINNKPIGKWRSIRGKK